MADFLETLGWALARSCGVSYANKLKNGERSPVVPTANEVMTGIRFTKQKLNAVNNCTFIFDPTYDSSFNGTFPIAFFWVKGMTERMESKMTNKSIIFFDETVTDTEAKRSATTQIISDNIVAEPKEYTLDVLVPYGLGQIITSRCSLDMTTDVAIMSTQAAKGATYSKSVSGFNSFVDILTEVVKTLIESTDVAFSVDYKGSPIDAVKSIFSEKDYNKNSIEAMWRNRSICTMKTWDGWKYKYVAITSVNLSKQPTDDNVYEGQITVREVPILTFRKKSIAAKYKFKGIKLAKKAEREAKKKVLEKTVDAMAEKE